MYSVPTLPLILKDIHTYAHKSEGSWRGWFLEAHQKTLYLIWLGPRRYSQLYQHKIIMGATAFSDDNSPGSRLCVFWIWQVKGVREISRTETPTTIKSNNFCGYLCIPDITVQLSSDCTELCVGSLLKGWRRIFHFMHHLQLPSIIQQSQYISLMHS